MIIASSVLCALLAIYLGGGGGGIPYETDGDARHLA